MKKLLIPVMCAVLLLAGCSKSPDSYTFSDKELSNAIGMSKESVDKLPDRSSLFGTDSFYLFEVPHSGGKGGSDSISMLLTNGKVSSIHIDATVNDADEKSEHSLCGIWVREKTYDALTAAEAYFGSRGIIVSDPDTESASSTTDVYRYGSKTAEKGELRLTVDSSAGVVVGLELTVQSS